MTATGLPNDILVNVKIYTLARELSLSGQLYPN
jgi:hypothetical protein